MPLKDDTKRIFLDIADARTAAAKFQAGEVSLEELGNALVNLLASNMPLREPGDVGDKLEAEAIADRLIDEILAEEKAASVVLPELVEATNRILPKHVSLAIRKDSAASVNVLWHGFYAGTISTHDGRSWDVGQSYQDITFDSLRDAAIATAWPLIRGTKFLGYSQLGEEVLTTREYGPGDGLMAEVKRRLDLKWTVLQWNRDPYCLDYEWVVMRDPSHTSEN